MKIEIGTIGYNHVHEKDFTANFPKGPGSYLFLLIKTNSIFTITKRNKSQEKAYEKLQKQKINVTKNSFIILNPETCVSYKGENGKYIDDWFFFWINDDDKNEMLSNGIQFDTPIFLNNIDELSNLIHKIAFEHFSGDSFHNEIEENYINIFFHLLFRIIKTNETISPQTLLAKNDRITYLRTRIYQNPSFFENIDDIATFVNLSKSGLQHLYKSIFGHGIMLDIITARIEKAKEYLLNTNLTISEISSKCGYTSDIHFMRQFKQITKETPTEYRRKQKGL